MSLRAIKKRSESQSQQSHSKKSNFKKSLLNSSRKFYGSAAYSSGPASFFASTLSSVHSLEQQRTLLGRSTRSNPELCKLSDTLELLSTKNARLVRTKSETDVNAVLKTFTGNVSSLDCGNLVGAKSEISLQTISVHNTAGFTTSSSKLTTQASSIHQQAVASCCPEIQMLSGARSHRDLSQSSYGTAADYVGGAGGGTLVDGINSTRPLATRRRMSECSFNSAYSQRTSALSASALTLSHDGSTSIAADTAAVRVPIIGYEVMEERARFTVYKLRVENPYTNDCWLVLRRYTDFVRFNTKLKQAFPHITFMLPRKKIFGDNFNAVFLDNRVQGLQMFVNSIMSKHELRKCKIVREFFCLDEPPTYSESMEECRAIFEAQEETIAHLKMQINSKNEVILSLQQKLRDEMTEKDQLKEAMKNISINCSSCAAANNSKAVM